MLCERRECPGTTLFRGRQSGNRTDKQTPVNLLGSHALLEVVPSSITIHLSMTLARESVSYVKVSHMFLLSNHLWLRRQGALPHTLFPADERIEVFASLFGHGIAGVFTREVQCSRGSRVQIQD